MPHGQRLAAAKTRVAHFSGGCGIVVSRPLARPRRAA
jgi:hypothetical protein